MSDTGKGIAPDRLDRLFEIGFSEAARRVHMNTGLSNVRATVEKHCGEIDVSSVPGEGATFTIDLPVSQSAER